MPQASQGRPADAQDARARLHDSPDRPLRLVRHRRHADLCGARGLPLLVTEHSVTADEFNAGSALDHTVPRTQQARHDVGSGDPAVALRSEPDPIRTRRLAPPADRPDGGEPTAAERLGVTARRATRKSKTILRS